MEVTKIKTGRQKNMEAEKLIEALHTVEKLKERCVIATHQMTGRKV